MSFRALLRPGQGFKPFTVYKRTGGKTESGRPLTAKVEKLEEQGRFFGIISQADPREIEQWKQNGHPITHTIVQRGTEGRAFETDVLEQVDPKTGKKRRFLVQTIHDPGELGHFLVYKVEERRDLQ